MQADQTGKRFDHVLIFGHGGHIDDQPNRYGLAVPPDVTTEQGTDLAAVKNLRRLGESIAPFFDNRTTLMFMGCQIGNDQALLDAFRGLLGGQVTVIAPKHFELVELADPRKKGSFDHLVEHGLLRKASNERDLNKALANVAAKLGEKRDRLYLRQGLKSGQRPIISMVPDKDHFEDRLYPNETQPNLDYGFSSPDGVPPAAVQQRFLRGFPGFNAALPLDTQGIRPIETPTKTPSTHRTDSTWHHFAQIAAEDWI
jgi:hypothetical protein